MFYTPLNYNQIMPAQGTVFPVSVKAYNNVSFAYWERALFQRMSSVFDFRLPESWQGSVSDFFYWCLFRFGFIAITYKEELGGYVFQPATVSGFNLYYQPVRCIIANPDIRISGEYEIGTQCEILKLCPDFMGAWDIVSYYAEKLSSLDVAVNTNIINSKYAFILAGRNKAAVDALKVIVDRVNRGEPAVFLDKALTNDRTDKDVPFQFQPIQDVKGNYIVAEQLRDLQTLLNAFDNEIGIPTVPYEKRERMVTDEATSREKDAVSRITVWQRSLDSSLVRIRELYPDLDISYKLRSDIEESMEGGAPDAEDQPDSDV